jgi:hypothetical protein
VRRVGKCIFFGLRRWNVKLKRLTFFDDGGFEVLW